MSMVRLTEEYKSEAVKQITGHRAPAPGDRCGQAAWRIDLQPVCIGQAVR